MFEDCIGNRQKSLKTLNWGYLNIKLLQSKFDLISKLTKGKVDIFVLGKTKQQFILKETSFSDRVESIIEFYRVI